MEKAKEFAIKNHGDQKYGEFPYAFHLRKVVGVLERFGYGDSQLLVSSAWLHDVVEDTNVTIEEIDRIFGENVADIVWRVTTSKDGKNRKERHLKTYPKIRGRQEAVLVKLADRIANSEQCCAGGNPGLHTMYQKEYPAFRKALYRQDEFTEMWDLLDTLLLI